MEARKALIGLPIFLSLFLPTTIVFLAAWYFLIDGKLYYCSDKVPLLDFIPPFVHDRRTGDYFIAPSLVVYLIWMLFILLMALIPYFLTRKFFKEKH